MVISTKLFRSDLERRARAGDLNSQAACCFFAVGKARMLGRTMALSSDRRKRM